MELSVPKVLETSGPVPPAAAAEDEAVLLLSRLVRRRWPLLLLRLLVSRPSVAAKRSRSHLPLLVLNLPALALGVEGRVNQMVEVVEAVVHERVLKVII
jgi:hypothetical protein